MRKSTIFISAALTTMMLVMLFGVVSAYQTITSSVNSIQTNPDSVPQQQLVSNVAAQPTAVPTLPAQLTAEQAAQLAAQTIGRTDLYSVETTTWNGLQAYLVTFSSGDLVYVSPEGQILEITKIQPAVVTISNVSSRGGNSRNNGGGEHESNEHEGGDD